MLYARTSGISRQATFFQINITGNLKYFGQLDKKIRRDLSEDLYSAAKFGVKAIQNAYKNPNKQENHPFDKFLSFYFGFNSDIPLYKSGELAKNVKFNKDSDFQYSIFVDPAAMSWTGQSSRPIPYWKVAALQEQGYFLTVTDRLRKFWRKMALIYRWGSGSWQNAGISRISSNLRTNILVVPPRPVWEPSSVVISAYIRTVINKDIRTSIRTTKAQGRFRQAARLGMKGEHKSLSDYYRARMRDPIVERSVMRMHETGEYEGF
jgi:hypothetical protein